MKLFVLVIFISTEKISRDYSCDGSRIKKNKNIKFHSYEFEYEKKKNNNNKMSFQCSHKIHTKPAYRKRMFWKLFRLGVREVS